MASVNSVKRNGHRLLESIGVNDAGVAGVATPQYFDKCFIFFPSVDLLNTASRCHFHLHRAQCAPYHIILRRKIHKFPGKVHTPLAAYGASILASSALDLRPPNVPVAFTPMACWQGHIGRQHMRPCKSVCFEVRGLIAS